MKSLLVLIALNVISRCHLVPLGLGVGGGFVKHGGFVVGPSASQYSEGYIDGAGGGGGAVGAGGGAGFSASFGGIGGVGGSGFSKTIGVEKHIVPAAHAQVISEKVLEVETEAPLPPPPAQKTVIERTIIPNYVEKKVRVPTYVEKTIRVPAFVEKTIKVPAEPTVVEKTISQEDVPAPEGHKVVETKFKSEAGASVPAVPDYGDVRVYHRIKTRPHRVYEKDVITSGGGGYNGGAGYVSGAGYGGSGFGGGTGGGGFSAHASAGGGRLFDGIFNIPIQTLGAVRGLLNDLSGGGGAGFSAGGSFSKGYSTY